jgi:hypothetical protein
MFSAAGLNRQQKLGLWETMKVFCCYGYMERVLYYGIER